MKKWIVLDYVHYGDDWESEYKDVFENEEDAKKFEIEHRRMHVNVSGIESIEFHYSEMTELELRDVLTVNEYIEIFPKVKDLLDNKNY